MEWAERFKEGQRRTWAAGDFPSIAGTIEQAARVVVARLPIEPGNELLDVATGSGNVAIAAAKRGARVTGIDLVPELIDAARARAEAEGVEVDLRVGDAEDLPFGDGSFDLVTSTFGTMFAPRHQQAADELVRVARPGATIAVTAWTPEGLNGEFFRVVGAQMPPPPPDIQPPVLWGDEDHVHALFSLEGLDVTTERLAVTVAAESVEAWVSYCEKALGPVVMAKAALEPQGKWQETRDAMVEMYSRYNEATDGTLSAPGEYLLTVVRVASSASSWEPRSAARP